MTRPRLHVVALSHLDTQWRWTVRDTVERFLPATFEANERLFERYPRFVLSFEGTWRYRLLAEHHPHLFARVLERVAEGRWHPAGAAVEAFDTLLPAPESIVRQILYGRRWLRRELAADSRDLLLPDCFGFPRTLPTLAAHLGLVGFSTQKLRRGALMRAARGIPFAYGRWRGADGGEVLAALDPGEYSGCLAADPTRDEVEIARARTAVASGVPAIAMRYIGVGDRGGAVPDETVERLAAALDADGPLEIHHGASEEIFLATTDAERAALPVHDGELLLRLHGTGCYTAKTVLKRCNRRVEVLARAAEAAAVAALAAGHPAPCRRLEEAWTLLLAHQMHDDLTGTAIPAAYEFTLADLGLAANELEEVLLDAAGRAAGALDTGGSGPRLVALATVAAPHEALLEVRDLPATAEAVVGADGLEREVQRLAAVGGAALVPASFAGVELQVLRLGRGSPLARKPASGVTAGERWLESERYRLELDAGGALASLVDKRLGRELLAAPARLELLPDHSAKYPAWEIRWEDSASSPRGHVDRLRRIAVIERGPLRAALAVERCARGVVVRETWRLASGDAGDLVVADVEIDWRRRATLLKASFPLAAANPSALYDTGLGAIERPLASEALYEVPAQHWAAVEDVSGSFAVALFADCRHGWDHPDARTLRSTWIHAPRANLKWRHQATQDFGRHRLRFALAGLPGGAVDDGAVAALAERFVHRPRVFHVRTGGSPDGPRRRTLLTLPPPLRLLALKPAEDDDRAVLRLSNPARDARPVGAASDLPALGALRTVTGMEEELEPPASGPPTTLSGGGLATCFTVPLRSSASAARDGSLPLPLPWSVRGVSRNGERPGGDGFDGRGRFLPRELLPGRIDDTAVPFDLTHLESGRGDVVVADGQLVELPAGTVEVWLLAAAVGGERTETFDLDGAAVTAIAPDWRRPLLSQSRWRARLAGGRIEPGELRRRPTAWSCGHLHDRGGADLAVARATLFALHLPAAGARRLRLPRDPGLRILAATVSTRAARPLAAAEPPFLV